MTSSSTPMVKFWTDEEPHGFPFTTQAQPLRILYFDLETRVPLEELGGSWARVKMEGGVSMMVVWDDLAGAPLFFDDHDLEAAAKTLEGADLVVSFNGRYFDVPLLEQHLGRSIQLKEHWDLFHDVEQALRARGEGFRGYGLGAICERTIGKSKTGSGKDAPHLARTGKWAELVSYTLSDVLLCRDLATHIRENGSIVDKNGENLTVEVPFWLQLTRGAEK